MIQTTAYSSEVLNKAHVKIHGDDLKKGEKENLPRCLNGITDASV